MKRFVEATANKYAFFPPSPPWYGLRDKAGNELRDKAGNLQMDSRWPYHFHEPGHGPSHRVLQLQTKRGQTLAAVYVTAARKVQTTLLFSHGNAVDIGQLVPYFQELATTMSLNVLGYDYSGYGCSTGTPSVSNTLADINACYQWLLSQGCRARDVILYGQSVGSGPTIDLASRTPGLGGVVLHSPLLSGMQVMKPEWKWWPAALDIYPNAGLISKIDAPVLIMHGVDDDVVGIDHGRKLHSLLQKPYPPLWAKHKGHQDLETADNFMTTLRDFARSCTAQS